MSEALVAAVHWGQLWADTWRILVTVAAAGLLLAFWNYTLSRLGTY